MNRGSAKGSSKKSSGLIFSLTATFVILSLFFLLIEGIAWVLVRLDVVQEYPSFEIVGTQTPMLYHPDLGWVNKPGEWRQEFNLGEPIPVSISNQGLRDRTYQMPKPKNTRRILVLGDSFTWGWGVKVEDTFAKVLEKQLGRELPEIEVINAGVTGYGTDQELLWLEKIGYKFEPDIVIVFFFVNDLMDNSNSISYQIPKPIFVNDNGGLRLTNTPTPRLVEELTDPPMALTSPAFLTHSSSFRILLTRAQSQSEAARWLDRSGLASLETLEQIDPKIPWFEQTNLLFKKIADRCKKLNAPLLIVLAPDSRSIGQPLDQTSPYFHLLGRLKEHRLEHLELNQVFTDHGLTQADLCLHNIDAKLNLHYSPAGHKIVAEAIHQIVRTWLDMKKR